MSRRTEKHCGEEYLNWIWGYINHNELSVEEYHYRFCGVCKNTYSLNDIYQNRHLTTLLLLQHIQKIQKCNDKAECGGSNCGIFQMTKYYFYKRRWFLQYQSTKELDIQRKRRLITNPIITRNGIGLRIGTKVDAMHSKSGIWFQCKVISLETNMKRVVLEKLYLPPFIDANNHEKTQFYMNYYNDWWMIDKLESRCNNDHPYGIHTMYTSQYSRTNNSTVSARYTNTKQEHTLLEIKAKIFSPYTSWNAHCIQLTDKKLKICQEKNGAKRWSDGYVIDICPNSENTGIKSVKTHENMFNNLKFRIIFTKHKTLQLKCDNISDLVDILCTLHCICDGIPVIPPMIKPHSLSEFEECLQTVSVSMKSYGDMPNQMSHLLKYHETDIKHDLVFQCDPECCVYKRCNKSKVSISYSPLSCESRRVSVMLSETKEDDFTPAHINPTHREHREFELHGKGSKYHHVLMHSFADNQSHVISDQFDDDDDDEQKSSYLHCPSIELLLQKKDIKALMGNIKKKEKYYSMQIANKELRLSERELLALVVLVVQKSKNEKLYNNDGIVMRELQFHLIHAIYKMYQVHHLGNDKQEKIECLFHLNTNRYWLSSFEREAYTLEMSMFSSNCNTEIYSNKQGGSVIAIGDVYNKMYNGHLYAVDIAWLCSVLKEQFIVLKTTMKGLKPTDRYNSLHRKQTVYYTDQYRSFPVGPKYGVYK